MHPASRFNPASSLSLMDEVLRDFFPTRGNGEARRATRWAPPVSVKETAEGYQIEAELPGLRPEDIEITFEKDTLLLRGEKKQEETREGETWHVYERRQGSFERRFTFPARVDVDSVEAAFEHGLLRVSLRKAKESQPRKIEVRVAAPKTIDASETKPAE